VAGLTEMPMVARGEQVWIEVWARAEAAFARARGLTSTEADAAAAPSDDRPSEWLAELVTEMQSVARQHPMGRW
jgi:hypothetical protein